MKIAQSKTREQFPLSYKKITKKTLQGTLFLTILLCAIWFLALLVYIKSLSTEVAAEASGWFGAATLIIFGFLSIVIALTYLYQRWYFAVYFYDLTPDFIQIRKGPITPREITVPYERVQDIYVDQDLLDRILGLYDVHISSATISSGMAAHVDGVEKQAAEGLRATLLKTIKEKISKPQNPAAAA